MRDLYFDRFTRTLAKAVDRREALKVFAGGALGGLMLTYAGCDLPWKGIGPGEEECDDPETDKVTAGSLEAAQAALAAGATEVKLSPRGCYRVARKFSGGRVTEESLVIAGRPVIQMQQSAGAWVIRQDSDGDGFDEWQAELTLDAAGSEQRYVATEFDPDTRLPAHRQTLTPAGNGVHVRLEEDRGLGLRVVGDFVRPPHQDAGCESPCKVPANPTRCTDAQCQQLKSQLFQALNDAVVCLHETMNSPKFGDRMVWLAAAMPPIECSDELPSSTRARTERPRLWPLLAKILVNRSFFCSFDATCQKDSLIHELMHPMFPEHHEDQEKSSRRHHVDRVYACAWICSRGKQNSTRTQCQVCLGTKDKCDDRCSSFAARPPAAEEDCYKDATNPSRQAGTLGWQCGNQWFETRGGCAAGCSGGSAGCSPDRINCRHLT